MQVQKPRQGYKLVKSLFGKYEEIPENWKLDSLNNLKVKSSSGGTPSREESEYYTGEILWVKSGELEDKFIEDSGEKITQDALKNSSAKIFPKNTVLVAMYGATIGKTGILMVEGTTNQAVCAILPNDIFDQYFLQQYLIRNRRILVTFGMGAGQPNISQEIIKNFKYLVPPKPEQQKIASILSNVDSLIQQTQKEIEQTQRLKKGLMQRLLTKGIGHTKFKKVKSLFGKYEEIPESWERIRLIEKCSKKPQYGAVVSAVEKNSKLPRYVRITDLNDDGSLRDEEWKSISEADAKEYILTEGDILFARTGATVGKTFLYQRKHGRCAFAGYMIRFVPNPTKLDSKFLFHYTHSYLYWKWLKSIQTWGVQPNVNAEQYSNMMILLPPINEQQKIASILLNVDSLIQKQQEYKSKLETLKKGLMQKLLTGQIRVKV